MLAMMSMYCVLSWTFRADDEDAADDEDDAGKGGVEEEGPR